MKKNSNFWSANVLSLSLSLSFTVTCYKTIVKNYSSLKTIYLCKYRSLLDEKNVFTVHNL